MTKTTDFGITIGLLWHSANSGNLGVGALTMSHLALLRQACRDANVVPKFILLGFVDPGRAVYVTGEDIEIVALNGRQMLPGGAYERQLRSCDIVFDIGGGDSWSDIYGKKRFAYLWWSKLRVIQRKIPLVLAPQTIGPFTDSVMRIMASKLMKAAELVVARDPMSAQAAQGMSPGAKIQEAIDVAFALPSTPWPRLSERPVVGVNVSGLLYNRGYDGNSDFGMEIDYRGYVHALLETLGSRTDIDVKLVSHVHSEAIAADDDWRVAQHLASVFDFVELVPPFSDPVEAKSCIASFDFLTAARMHACIAAYSAGVAVFPVAYSRKFAGLFSGALNYDYGVPVRGATTDEAVSMTLNAIETRAEMAAATRQGRELASERLAVYCASVTSLLRGNCRN